MNSLDLLKEPFFYICSLVVGLALNVIGNLVTPKIEKVWANISKNRRQKQISINLEKLQKVSDLQKYSDERTETILNAIHNNTLAIFLMVVSFGVFWLATLFKGIIFLTISSTAAVLFILSMKIVDRGTDEIFFARLAFKRMKACRELSESKGIDISAEEFENFLKKWDRDNLGPLE
jgi:hypothetical protein